MISPVSSALSAISAYQKRMDVTADNVANIETDRFKKSRVNMEEGENGGVKTSIQRIDTPGMTKEVMRGTSLDETESSNVDLAEELTDMMTTKAGYTANAKTLKTQNEMLGNLFDILG
ncbi:MAG: flagellar basal body protein [Desulfobacteraceae bacterium]|nr:flagellar basal body protein [Desulfobacteraceae bacterium]